MIKKQSYQTAKPNERRVKEEKRKHTPIQSTQSKHKQIRNNSK